MTENNLSQKILSDIVVYNKYAKYDSKKQRRETWKEIVTRNKEMHLENFPQLKKEIEEAYKFVYDKKVLPSMRSLQFAGKPIEINNSRILIVHFYLLMIFVHFQKLCFYYYLDVE